ncbi:hypothetical protein [uncultured Methanofollis sp.]|uniref:hypothetical protein n=1 Tax=uncultured Methanofollis sp. TaxID=262500 RepID=UPI00260CCFEE|nr:hypothetical protein [uncultured Methanofollis sp.]
MSLIKNAVVAGAVVYGVILLIEAARHPSFALTAIATALILAAVGVLFGSKDEHRLKTTEMALLWATVSLFLLYGLLKVGGVL